jgi:ABC-type transport system involved in multi-copper enzyme maturation permease subunit
VSQSIVGRLILKDLYLSRWVIAGAFALGILTLGIAPLSEILYFVSSVSFIVTLILLNVFVVMFSVGQERKDKVILFVLSLPVSTGQYAAAKLAAALIAFLVPFVFMLAGSAAVVLMTDLPNGSLPVTFAIGAYVLLYFCVFLGVTLNTASAVWATLVIVFGNVGVSFLIPAVNTFATVRQYGRTETLVWSGDMLTVIGVELALSVAALVAFFVITLRKKDFI